MLQKAKADSKMGYVPTNAELAAPTESASADNVPQTTPGVNGQKSTRDTDITDREILAATLETSAQTERERVLLEQYRRHAMELRDLERDLDNQRKKLQDHESGKKPLGKTELNQTRNRAALFARRADKKA